MDSFRAPAGLRQFAISKHLLQFSAHINTHWVFMESIDASAPVLWVLWVVASGPTNPFDPWDIVALVILFFWFLTFLCVTLPQLKDLFPRLRLALPPKRWLKDNYDEEFLEERQIGLQNFLHNLTLHEEVIRRSVVTFLPRDYTDPCLIINLPIKPFVP